MKAWLHYILFMIFVAVSTQPGFAGPNCSDKRVVVFGDSLVAGFGLDPGDSFPEQLSAYVDAKGYKVSIVNAGVSGDTTSGGLSRLDWSLGDKVDLVVLELGANDALRGIPVEVTRKNLEMMISSIKAKGVDVLLAGMMAPPNLGEDYGEAFNRIYPELAAEHDVPLYPFFLDGVAADPELNLDDGMHPNKSGVAEMVKRMGPMILESLEKICTD